MANLRTQISDLISANPGQLTAEDIMAELGIEKKANFSSQLSYLRMAADYGQPVPAVNANGRFEMISAEAWKERQTERTTTKKVRKDPVEERARLEKRSSRCASTVTNAKRRADLDPDNELLALKAQKAEIELKIAELELGAHFAAYPDLEESIETTEDEAPEFE